MTKKTIWAVSSGEYSDYTVHALYEDKADAEAVAERLGEYVEEFPLYAPGDRSFRQAATHVAAIEVHADGTFAREWTYSEHQYVDDHSSINVPVTETPVLRWEPNLWHVRGRGLTEEGALKAARDRAAQVAALAAEGLDPMTVERGK